MKIRNKNVYWMLFLCMIVNMYGVVSADISPKPRSFADTPAPTQKNEEVSVEMVKEVVELTLYKKHLDVVAEFWMKNHDKGTVRFETGFPVGAFKNIVNFSVTINGKEIPATLIDRHSSKTDRHTPFNQNDYWYVWDAIYPGESTEKHEVRYSVELYGYHHPAGPFPTGYILSTGKAWKNPIGNAIVTLRFGDDMSSDCIRGISPETGCKVYKDKVVWTRSNFEPESYDNIQIEYSRVPMVTTLLDNLASLENEMQDVWNTMNSPDSTLSQRESLRSKMHGLSKQIQDQKRELLKELKTQNSEARKDAQKALQQNQKRGDAAAAGKSKEMMDQSDENARKLRELEEKLNKQTMSEGSPSRQQMDQAIQQAPKGPKGSGPGRTSSDSRCQSAG